MDNKFIKILVFGAFLLASGIVYQKEYRPAELERCKETGITREVHMRVLENQWMWEPAQFSIGCGDKVKLFIYNEDSYDHGFALEAFGVNKRLFPKRETEVDFVASKGGDFSFYCSVPCGEGHYRQTGKVIVTPQDLEKAPQSDSSPQD